MPNAGYLLRKEQVISHSAKPAQSEFVEDQRSQVRTPGRFIHAPDAPRPNRAMPSVELMAVDAGNDPGRVGSYWPLPESDPVPTSGVAVDAPLGRAGAVSA